MQSMRDLIEAYRVRTGAPHMMPLDASDAQERRRKQHVEVTTTANVGTYERPFGPPLRPAFPHPEGVLDDYEDEIERATGKKVKTKRR